MPFSSAIYEVVASTGIDSIVGDKFYPLLVPQEMQLPYVAWVMSMTPTYGDDEVCQDVYKLDIHCASESYDEAHKMGEIIREIELLSPTTIDGYLIHTIIFDAMEEQFEEGWDSFHVIYSFTIKVNKT